MPKNLAEETGDLDIPTGTTVFFDQSPSMRPASDVQPHGLFTRVER